MAGLASRSARTLEAFRLENAELRSRVKRLLSSDIDAAVSCANRIVTIGEETGDATIRADGNLMRALCCNQQLRYEEALTCAEAALPLYNTSGDALGAAQCLDLCGTIHRQLGRFETALECLLQCMELVEQHGFNHVRGQTLSKLGTIVARMGNHSRALLYFREALDHEAGTSDERSRCGLLGNIGGAYMEMKDYDKAVAFLEEAAALATKTGRLPVYMTSVYNLGYIEMFRKQFDAAMRRAAALVEFCANAGDDVQATRARDLLATIHLERGEPDLARSLLERTIRRFAQLSDPLNEANSRHTLAVALLKLDRPVEALKECRRAIDVIEGFGSRQYLGEMYDTESRVHEMLGDLPAALAAQRLAMARKEEYRDREEHLKAVSIERDAEFETARREREIFRLKAKELELVAEGRERELNAMALNLAQRNELLKSIAERIDGATAPSAAHAELTELARFVHNTVHNAQDVDAMFARITNADQPLFQMLLARAPALTQTELRICSLLKLRLATKDIAGILSTDARTIDDHRSSIRTKLALDAAIDLAEYVRTSEQHRTAAAAGKESDFLVALRTRFSSLNDIELRECALLRMNMPTKTIAATLGLSTRTVEKHRLHLRKKLGLSADTNLAAFLMKF